MSWLDRLREAAYNSPSGVRQTFDFEDVRNTRELRGSAFNFPDADGTYIQRTGNSGRQFPLRVFFWGDDCDLQAEAFDALLLEPGVGKIEHPMYGTVEVVPFGPLTRRDDLKTAANQAILEFTLWETVGLVYPTGQADPGTAVLSAVADFNAAAAGAFSDAIDLDTTIERVTFKNGYLALLDSVKSGLAAVATTEAAVEQQFNTIVSSVELGIDTLVADPLSLAFQTSLLIQAPARAAAAISARLSAYRDLAEAITTGDGATVPAGYDSRGANAFQTNDIYAMSYVSGAVLSVVNNQFETKNEALAAAVDVLEQFEAVAAWRDTNYEALGEVDTGAAYQQLQEAVALTAGFLVFISFSLKQERRIVLDRARTMIDLVAELYGTVDSQLDFFINSNSLTGSEILEIPAGREVVYYV
ncbi:DNA circularization N-terminal domain-containing protein [bacterium]|nr:DNA circularization N-terminal domain-containing protein [bacterium]